MLSHPLPLGFTKLLLNQQNTSHNAPCLQSFLSALRQTEAAVLPHLVVLLDDTLGSQCVRLEAAGQA